MSETMLKRRLWVGMAAKLGVIAAVSALGFMAISHEINEFGLRTEHNAALQDMTHEIMIDLLQQRRFEKDYFLNIGQPEWQQEYLRDFLAQADAFQSLLDGVAAFAASDPLVNSQISDKLATIKKLHKDYLQGFKEIVGQVGSDPRVGPQQANDLMEAYKRGLPNLEKDIREIKDVGDSIQELNTKQAIDNVEGHVKRSILAIFLGGLALSVLIGGWMGRAVDSAALRKRLRDL